MSDRLVVIGDVHGCARELDALLAGLALAPGDTAIFVGDYIDRGPDSRAVIEQILALGARGDVRTVFLKGNHEDMCLAWLGRPGRWGEAWFANGGVTTLRSYGIDARVSPRDAAILLPPEHVEFLEALRPYHREPGLIAVHAGIRPGVPLEAQDEADLFWIREEFIESPHQLPETIVFGHTPMRDVLVDLPYKIGIDTGCVYGGALTALDLPARVVHQVRRDERAVRTRELDPRATMSRAGKKAR
jgi:serine/threonine protein phosphatase 1